MNTRTNHGAIVPIERIELLPFTLPTPPPGMKWHHEDGWNDGDLPRGTRPLIEGEKPQKGDFCILDGESVWQESINWWSGLPASSVCRYRTTRPLLFTHSWNEWTWHSAGDPMPCDGKSKQPLGPGDVPPFSAIRRKPEQDHGQQWHWRCVSYVHGVGVQCGNLGYKWEELQKDYQINRSIPLTGKWNPDAWESCEK